MARTIGGIDVEVRDRERREARRLRLTAENRNKGATRIKKPAKKRARGEGTSVRTHTLNSNEEGETYQHEQQQDPEQGQEPEQESEQEPEQEPHNIEAVERVPHPTANKAAGGPIDDSVINTYDNHIASKLWVGQERDPMVLQMHNHVTKLHEWPVSSVPMYISSVLQSARLLTLVEFAQNVDKPLLSAFVDRWYPEGNSAHFRWGEMTITGYDVEAILGIPMTGKPITCTRGDLKLTTKVELLMSNLGVSEEDATRMMKNKNEVTLKWLKDTFMEYAAIAPPHDRPRVIRAYMLYVIGTVLYPNKSGNGVPVKFLQCLGDVKEIPSYSWGSAVIVDLYRQLGAASRHGTKQLAGCLNLLQVWMYEHFPQMGHASIRPEYVEGQPRIKKWVPRPPPGSLEDSLHHLRVYFDTIPRLHVVFDPYRNARALFPLSFVVFYSGILVCLDLAESYYPERVLRQFGKLQDIPKMPIYRQRGISGTSAKDYNVGYNHCHIVFTNWQDHMSNECRVARDVDIGETDIVPQYITWYNVVSHLMVNPPDRSVATEVERRIAMIPPPIWMDHGSIGNRLKAIAKKLFCMADDVASSNNLNPDSIRRVGQAVERANDVNFLRDFPEFAEPSTSGPSVLGEITRSSETAGPSHVRVSTSPQPLVPQSMTYRRKNKGKNVQQ